MGSRPSGTAYTPYVEGNVVRQKISRTNDYAQAGELYRSYDQRHKDDLINNLVSNLSQCNRDIQERMVGHLLQCDQEYGSRVAQGLGISVQEPAEMAVTD